MDEDDESDIGGGAKRGDDGRGGGDESGDSAGDDNGDIDDVRVDDKVDGDEVCGIPPDPRGGPETEG